MNYHDLALIVKLPEKFNKHSLDTLFPLSSGEVLGFLRLFGPNSTSKSRVIGIVDRLMSSKDYSPYHVQRIQFDYCQWGQPRDLRHEHYHGIVIEHLGP